MRFIKSIQEKWQFRKKQVAVTLGVYRYLVEDQYFQQFGYLPNLAKPVLFTEKIQWLKVYDKNPLYTRLADKYDVRGFVRERIGQGYLNDLLGLYDHVEQIEFDMLPDQFVLKVTHGSSYNIICPNKDELDWEDCRKRLSGWLRKNHFNLGYEWAYKNIRPRIVCEKFMQDEAGGIPKDYKFFCFEGVPKFIQVDTGRYSDHYRDMMTTEWQPIALRYHFPHCPGGVARPENLQEMLDVATALSAGLRFCRVDLYHLPRVVFGEMTFYPDSGWIHFEPASYDKVFGDLIPLS